MKKKIMLIVPMLHQGGFERVCVATARLLEQYYDVYIVIFSSADIAYDIRGLQIIDLKMGTVESKLGKIRNVFRRSRRVAALKKELGIEIAYSFGPTANLVNVFSRSAGKVWCGIRSYMDMGNPRNLRLFCNRSDLVICCSRIIEKELQEKYGCTRTTTLYNPFDIQGLLERSREEDSQLPFRDAERVVISMGRQDDVKGFWHLVKSFSLVHQKYQDARLVVVGEGDFQEYWKLAQDLHIEDAVSFPGVKKNPFPYLALGNRCEERYTETENNAGGKCDVMEGRGIYVMTSLNEGFPNVLVEAMALGKPVISTNCMTGPAEILAEDFASCAGQETYLDADYGILIPNLEKEKNMDASVITEEEKKLAEQILRLMEDRELYRRYSAASSQRAAAFSNEAYVEKLRELMGE